MKDKQYIVFKELSDGSGNAKGLTSAENFTARYIYNSVRTGGMGTTVLKSVADYFRNSNYKVEPQVIGWRISL